MKTIFCFLFVTFIITNVKAQYPLPVDSVNAYFDTPDTIVFIPDSTSIWQIGKPNKTIFNSSFNSNNSIVTDTINSYPINDSSYFYAIYHPQWLWEYLGWVFPFQIDFYHRFNSDSINDFGLIQLSIDGGNTWFNCLSQEYKSWYYPSMNSHEILNTGVIQYDSIAITGTSNGWIHSIITKEIAEMNQPMIFIDSVIVKFSFHSDNLQTNKDGWQIDNLHIGQVLIPVSVMTKNINKKLIIQTFEPLNQFVFKMSDGLINQIKIFDTYGNLILIDSPHKNDFNLNMNAFPSGIYFYYITNGLEVYNGKFAVSN